MTAVGRTSAPTSDYSAIAGRIAADAQRFSPTQNNSLSRAGSPIADLVNKIMNSASPIETGGLLRSLDKMTGGRRNSEAVLNGSAPAAQAPKYDASSLYGAHGPRLSDIRQSAFGDCYFVATLGGMANERPSDIRNAISYDAKSQSFNVTLYDASGTAQSINVTQAEIDSNIARGGGGRRDDGVANAAIWPDVMEVAYAKQLDTDHSDGIEQGYTDLANGGWPKDAMRAITGSEGRAVEFSQGARETRSSALDRMGNAVIAGLKSDSPVTAWTVQESSGQDGLQDDHVYTVTRAFKDSNGDWQITMRNPWSSNMGIGEGLDRRGAFVTVPLETLVNTGGLNSFRIAN